MDDYQLTLADYLAILQRRARLIVASFFGVLATGVAVALLVPPTYQATGVILIESQQIPTDLVQSAVSSYAEERIEVIKQSVMTRENLLGVIRKHDLFAERGPASTSEQAAVMRKSISFELVNASLRTDRPAPATIAFSISFEHRQPEVAQAVANDLVTLFIEENVRARAQRASQTTAFLTQESEKLKKELDEIETQVAAYKQKHGAELPENTAAAMASMQRVEADLRQVDRDHAFAQEALQALEAERSFVRGDATAAAPTAAEGDLQRARIELARLQAIYTESHPDLRVARRRVEHLEHQVAVEAAVAPTAAARSGSAIPAAALHIDARATALRQRMRALDAQRSSLRAKLGQMDVALVRSPQVERGLLALNRDHQSAQRKYEEIVAKKMTAQVAENLEGGQKAERFRVLEPPNLPDRPVRPDRKKLLALAFILALGATAALVAFMETLHGVVRGPGHLGAMLAQDPLVLIPVIPVAAEEARRRKMAFVVVGGGVLAGGLALATVHFLVLPLHLLVMQALVRLG